MRDKISPKVTIIVPVYNETPANIGSSLSSVKQQTYQDFECVVIDESSNIESADACRVICNSDIRFIYIYNKKRIGLAASLNQGLSIGRGEFFARFDSDDICRLDRIEKQVRFLDENQEIDVVGGNIELINADGETIGVREYPKKEGTINRYLHIRCTIAHPTVMFRSKVVKYFGGYNTDYRYCEDLELWLRWQRFGVKFANIPINLVKYRQTVISRHRTHWASNLKARVKNLSWKYLFWRLLGLAVIGVWWFTPNPVKNCIFRVRINPTRNLNV